MAPGQINENQFQQLNQMNPSVGKLSRLGCTIAGKDSNSAFYVALALSLRGTVQNPFTGQAIYQQQQQPIQHSMQQQMNE